MDGIHSSITTIPRIGYRMEAMIFAEVGDFSSFESPDNLLACVGPSPSTYQSGQLKNCYLHMEKQGSRYLRYAIYNTAKYVCLLDPTFFAAYLEKNGLRTATTMLQSPTQPRNWYGSSPRCYFSTLWTYPPPFNWGLDF